MKRQRRWQVVEGYIVSPCAYLKPMFDATLAPGVSLHWDREEEKDIEPTPSSPLRTGTEILQKVLRIAYCVLRTAYCVKKPPLRHTKYAAIIPRHPTPLM